MWEREPVEMRSCGNVINPNWGFLKLKDSRESKLIMSKNVKENVLIPQKFVFATEFETQYDILAWIHSSIPFQQ